MCVVAESPRGHNYVIIRRHRGLRAATVEEAGCRGLHGFGSYDQQQKKALWSGLRKIIGSNLKGGTNGRG